MRGWCRCCPSSFFANKQKEGVQSNELQHSCSILCIGFFFPWYWSRISCGLYSLFFTFLFVSFRFLFFPGFFLRHLAFFFPFFPFLSFPFPLLLLSPSFLLSFSPSLLLSFSPSLLPSFSPSLLLSFSPSPLLSFSPSLLLSFFLSLTRNNEESSFSSNNSEKWMQT